MKTHQWGGGQWPPVFVFWNEDARVENAAGPGKSLTSFLQLFFDRLTNCAARFAKVTDMHVIHEAIPFGFSLPAAFTRAALCVMYLSCAGTSIGLARARLDNF